MPKLHCPDCEKNTDLRYLLIIPLGEPHACEHCGAEWKIRLHHPAELDATESDRPWMYITDDTKTWPEANKAVEAAWTNEAGLCVVRESWIHPTSDEWEGGPVNWRAYAWRPLREVEAPPTKKESE